jgi:hypothetical protein
MKFIYIFKVKTPQNDPLRGYNIQYGTMIYIWKS